MLDNTHASILPTPPNPPLRYTYVRNTTHMHVQADARRTLRKWNSFEVVVAPCYIQHEKSTHEKDASFSCQFSNTNLFKKHANDI